MENLGTPPRGPKPCPLPNNPQSADRENQIFRKHEPPTVGFVAHPSPLRVFRRRGEIHLRFFSGDKKVPFPHEARLVGCALEAVSGCV
jgi:hypothetical protein